MNQQEQATKRAAIFQDTINGTNDPTPWPVTMWASSGDTIWTAGTARTAGEDSVGMIYAPGETIAHRNTIAGDTTRATESFAIRPESGQSPMDAMLAGIEQWDHRHPDQWDTVTTPGEYRIVFCQVVIGQCGVSFPSEKAVGFSPVRNWPVIARVLLFHCIRA